ncbi:hypothetical protein, partial [Streptococcus suis]
GNAVSLKVRQKAGTTDQWEIYMPAGSMIKPNLFNGDRLQANKNDFLTRWPFVVDGAWNRNSGLNADPGIKLTAVAVPSGYVNKGTGVVAEA